MTQVTMCPETEQEAQSVSHGADLIVRLRRLLFSRLLRLLRRILLPVLVSCVPSSQLMFCPQGITVLLMLVVVLVAAAPELTARMRQANTADLSAMALPTPQKKTPLSGLRKHFPKQLWENIKMLENDTNSKLKLKELISVAFKFRMSKTLKLKQLPRSSEVPRKCGKFTASKLRLAYSQKLSVRQQDEENIDDEAMTGQKGKGTWSNPSQ